MFMFSQFLIFYSICVHLIHMLRLIISEAKHEVVYKNTTEGGGWVDSTRTNFHQVALHEGSQVSVIPSSHLHKHSEHFFCFPPFEASAALDVMRTSTNSHLMNCSAVAHVTKTKDAGNRCFPPRLKTGCLKFISAVILWQCCLGDLCTARLFVGN